MFPMMHTVFPRGPTSIYFMDMVISGSVTRERALQVRESHFLDDVVKRVNDDVWMELSFDLVKSSQAAGNLKVTYKKVLNALSSLIFELADIQRNSGHNANVMTKTIAVVRGIDPSIAVYRNYPKQLQALNSAL